MGEILERRKFIKSASIGSACALAGTSNLSAAFKAGKKCKITVLKKTLNEEWYQEIRGRKGEKCNVFQEGEEFILDSPWSVPEGFCDWAWGDIRTFIHKVNDGSLEKFVSCCTDGFRPVFFKIEMIEA